MPEHAAKWSGTAEPGSKVPIKQTAFDYAIRPRAWDIFKSFVIRENTLEKESIAHF